MAATRGSDKPLTAKEPAAWRAFVRALNIAPRVLDADLDDGSRLNMADYHVLVLLSERPEHAMRMNELAAEAILTPSGLTRVVERLTRRGLVERVRSQADGRGQVAQLTEVGFRGAAGRLPQTPAKRAHPRHAAPARTGPRGVHRCDGTHRG
jgi:DNA-binding MarR family transcriptional regulator